MVRGTYEEAGELDFDAPTICKHCLFRTGPKMRRNKLLRATLSASLFAVLTTQACGDDDSVSDVGTEDADVAPDSTDMRPNFGVCEEDADCTDCGTFDAGCGCEFARGTCGGNRYCVPQDSFTCQLPSSQTPWCGCDGTTYDTYCDVPRRVGARSEGACP